MKKCRIVLLALLLLVPVIQGEEAHQEEKPARVHKGCPARQAAELGYNAIENFHEIVAPIWHNAWPKKDYQALLSAAPKFTDAFTAIAKLEPTFKTKIRQKEFLETRGNFSKIVAAYADAAQRGDTAAVYELMPELHEAFEKTAAALTPVPYPELEEAAVTLQLIMERHLAQNNMEGITGSTDTLISKFDILTDTAAIPGELKDNQTEILTELVAMKELALQMKACCDKNDMQAYRRHAKTLDMRLKGFFKKYM